MAECSDLLSVNLAGLYAVTAVGGNFLAMRPNVAGVDLSPLMHVQSVQSGFCAGNTSVASVDLRPMVALRHIGDTFLFGCTRLTAVDLSQCDEVETIGGKFLCNLFSLEALDLSGLGRAVLELPHHARPESTSEMLRESTGKLTSVRLPATGCLATLHRPAGAGPRYDGPLL